MRALVAGGAGFIGSHLVERLLAEGYGVDVVDDLSSGSLANLAPARADATRMGAELKFHHLDVQVPGLFELAARRRPDIVFVLLQAPPAALFASSLNLLDAGRRAGAAKIVVGLDAIDLYGSVPNTELPVREGRAWAPRTPGGVAERAVIDLLAIYRARHDLEFTGLALANVYGPRHRRGVVAAFTEAAARGEAGTIHGDGRQTRDLLYVDDAVDAFLRAATRGSGLIVNVGTGIQMSVRELHRRVAGGDTEPKRGPVADDEPGRFALSPVRARIHLGWEPWTTLDDGLAAVRAAAT
jgi:UDP-glucose 4-epimerase